MSGTMRGQDELPAGLPNGRRAHLTLAEIDRLAAWTVWGDDPGAGPPPRPIEEIAADLALAEGEAVDAARRYSANFARGVASADIDRDFAPVARWVWRVTVLREELEAAERGGAR